MDFSCSSSSSLLVSLLLVLLLTGASSSGPSDLVRKICPTTFDNILCLEIFKSDPRSATADVKGLGRIIIDACEASANQTLRKFDALINGTPASPLEDRYQICARNYDTVITKLNTAKNLLSSPNYKSASAPAVDALHNILSCETTFILALQPVLPAGLDKLTWKTEKLARITENVLDFLV